MVQLKEQLEGATGVFVRHQKLIFKGKVGSCCTVFWRSMQPVLPPGPAKHPAKLLLPQQVLEDGATLEASKVASGAKLMLLASQAAGQVGRLQAHCAQTGWRVHRRIVHTFTPRADMRAERAWTHMPQSPQAPKQQAAVPSKRPGGKPGDLLAAAVAARGGTASSSGRGAGSTRGVAGRGRPLAAASLAERRSNWAKMGVVALRDLALEEVPPSCFDGLDGVRSADLSQVGDGFWLMYQPTRPRRLQLCRPLAVWWSFHNVLTTCEWPNLRPRSAESAERHPQRNQQPALTGGAAAGGQPVRRFRGALGRTRGPEWPHALDAGPQLLDSAARRVGRLQRAGQTECSWQPHFVD